MNNKASTSMSDQLLALYAQAPIPVAFLNRELKVVWANKQAISIHPSLNRTDGFFLLVPSQYTHTLQSFSATMPSSDPLEFYLPFLHRQIVLLPTHEREEPVGFLMQSFLSNPTQGSTLHPQGIEQLLSSFSNQFRNPLSVIFSTLSVLRTNPAVEVSPDVGELLQNINAQSYKILRSSILISDYIRYQSPLSPSDKSVINLSSFLQDLCMAANIVTSHIGIHITYSLPPTDILLSCEPKRLTHAVLQLIANSCRFTQEGNVVEISLHQSGDNAVVTITDKGLGIPSSQIEMIFDPFFSYDTFGMPFAGLGLGLTIFKYIIEQHRGTIVITSQEDEGTKVVFTLPIETDENLQFHDSPSVTEYLYDRFSSVYVILSDSCTPPKP